MRIQRSILEMFEYFWEIGYRILICFRKLFWDLFFGGYIRGGFILAQQGAQVPLEKSQDF